MKFMLLMIPAFYQGGKKVDPNFVPDPKKVEEMGRFNDGMGKALRIESLNGLHPQTTGARVSFGQGKPTVTDGPYIEANGWWRRRQKKKSSNGRSVARPNPVTRSKSVRFSRRRISR